MEQQQEIRSAFDLWISLMRCCTKRSDTGITRLNSKDVILSAYDDETLGISIPVNSWEKQYLFGYTYETNASSYVYPALSWLLSHSFLS